MISHSRALGKNTSQNNLYVLYFKQLCALVLVTHRNMSKGEYHSRAMMYPIIGTHRRLHGKNKRKNPAFPLQKISKRQNVVVQPS